jgi:hypothetical protein
MSYRQINHYHIWSDKEKDRIFELLTELLHRPEVATCASKRDALFKARCEFHCRRSLFPVIWIQMLWALTPKETSLLRSEHWNLSTNVLTLTADIAANGRARSFVVDRVTAALLNRLTDKRELHEPVFRAASGKRWNTAMMSHQFNRILRKLLLPGSLFSCRFYAIQTLMNINPGHLRSIIAITGHNSVDLVTGILRGASRHLSPEKFYEKYGDDGVRWLEALDMEFSMGRLLEKENAPHDSDDPEVPEALGPATTDSGPKPTFPPSKNDTSEDE